MYSSFSDSVRFLLLILPHSTKLWFSTTRMYSIRLPEAPFCSPILKNFSKWFISSWIETLQEVRNNKIYSLTNVCDFFLKQHLPRSQVITLMRQYLLASHLLPGCDTVLLPNSSSRTFWKPVSSYEKWLLLSLPGNSYILVIVVDSTENFMT